MIISASRRTDIPAFFGEWFANRLRAGSCVVPNPYNAHQLTTVSLRREEVNAFVFWTRDPAPFVPILEELEDRGFPSIVLFTLTGYGEPLEPFAPSLDHALKAFHQTADLLGPARVIWRYDPIVLGPGLGAEVHRARFARIAEALRGATKCVKVSFVDLYRKTTRRLSRIEGWPAVLAEPPASALLEELLRALCAIAAANGIRVETCAESNDWTACGARPGRCIDPVLLNELFGLGLRPVKDPGQRAACSCAPSRDIGMTDSCVRGCAYCYATRSHRAALKNAARHDPNAPSLLPLQHGPAR